MDRLERSHTDKMVFGVCGGLAANLEVDPVLVRVVFAILSIASGGTAVVGYLLLAVLMPAPSDQSGSEDGAAETEPSGSADVSSNLEQLRQEALEAAERFKAALSRRNSDKSTSPRGRQTWGIIVIVLGVLLLGGNLGWYRWFGFGEWWPVLVIAAGVALIAVNRRGSADSK